MKSTAVLLAICTIAVFATERFDCGDFEIENGLAIDNLDANSTNCCKSVKKTCETSRINGEVSCRSSQGLTGDDTKKLEENPSIAKCCKTTHCGKLRNGFECPIGYMPNPLKMSNGQTINNGLGELGYNKTACCLEFVKTCINTEDVGGNGADAKPFSCPDNKPFDYNKANNTDVKESVCCGATIAVIEDFEPTCSKTAQFKYDNFDCYAEGMQSKSGSSDFSPRNKTTCCDDFQSTCKRPTASSNIPYQCPDDKVLKQNSGNIAIMDDDDTTAEKDLRCCMDPTCEKAFDRTCADYPNCRSDMELTNLAVKASDDKVCCKKKDSTSSSTRREVAYSIFILGAISASLA